MSVRSAAWLFFACCCALPNLAAAFSDRDAFARSALEGGGEGHYFTGSPEDAFSCSVCHTGGELPRVQVRGLPEYLEPGRTHEVTIRWPESDHAYALTLELLAEDGSHAGLELSPESELPAASRCERAADGKAAVFAVDIGRRRVLGVEDCGATELKFRFTAPKLSALVFAMGVVHSDGSGTATGDGVLEIRRRLERDGGARSSAGCSALPGPQPAAAASWAFSLAALAYAARRRRGQLLAALIALVCAGCFQPRAEPAVEDAGLPYRDEFARLLDGRAGDAGAPATVSCQDDPSPLGRLKFSVRTVSGSGRYRPRNVGAIWIEDSQGKWQKTLERWGQRRAKWLIAFNQASGNDVTDAITSATLSEHRVHELEWDLTGPDGCEIPNGSYRVRLEMTDRSGAGETAAVPFDKLEAPLELMLPDRGPFRDLHLALE